MSEIGGTAAYGPRPLIASSLRDQREVGLSFGGQRGEVKRSKYQKTSPPILERKAAPISSLLIIFNNH